jgi:catechol 2,3-dioxygenase-like lactoylglutathione lyase family enzyme
MAIVRIESITYGVEDVAACTQFFADAGFEQLQASPDAALFRTPVNQQLRIRRLDDPALPPAVYAGSGIREITWGVDTPAGLEELRRELSSDREVRVDAEGALHSRDLTGYGIAFKVAQPAPAPEWVRDYNDATRVASL